MASERLMSSFVRADNDSYLGCKMVWSQERKRLHAVGGWRRNAVFKKTEKKRHLRVVVDMRERLDRDMTSLQRMMVQNGLWAKQDDDC